MRLRLGRDWRLERGVVAWGLQVGTDRTDRRILEGNVLAHPHAQVRLFDLQFRQIVVRHYLDQLADSRGDIHVARLSNWINRPAASVPVPPAPQECEAAR
jgi:hypothetical protein